MSAVVTRRSVLPAPRMQLAPTESGGWPEVVAPVQMARAAPPAWAGERARVEPAEPEQAEEPERARVERDQVEAAVLAVAEAPASRVQ